MKFKEKMKEESKYIVLNPAILPSFFGNCLPPELKCRWSNPLTSKSQ